jgi:hypothetical protein
MPCQDPNGAGDEVCGSTNPAQDLRDQGVVLGHVLDIYPDRLTIPDLVRELTAGEEAFAESDAFERAIRDLTGVGLLRCPSGIVEPTRAALTYYRLELDS